MLRDLARILLTALRCPCLWYCARFGRLDCGACKGWCLHREEGDRED